MSKETIPSFSIDLPSGWEDRTVYVFMGPDDSGVQHLMQLTVDPKVEAESLVEYGEDRIEAMMTALQGAEVLKKEEKTLPGGNQVYECVYKWVPVEGQINFNKVVYMIIDDVGYTITANFTKKTIKTIGVEVERMIDSFRPTGVEDDED